MANSTRSGSLDWIYEPIVENAYIGIIVYQLEVPGDAASLRLIYANDRSEFCLQTDPKPLVGQRILEAFPNLEQSDLPERLRKVVEDQQPADLGEVNYGDSHVPASDFLMQASPIGNGAVVITFKNITELRLARRALAELATQLEASLQEKQNQVIALEKMAALGSLIAGIAHELKTPVAAVRCNTDMLKRTLFKFENALDEESDGAHRGVQSRYLKALWGISETDESATAQLAELVRSLGQLSRQDRNALERVDLIAQLESSLVLVHHELKHRITVEREFCEVPPVLGHPSQINQVFTNLLINAAQAIDGQGNITLRAYLQGDEVVVEVRDSGSGMPESVRQRIFESGFTTKPAEQGTGLGLAITREIVRKHGGRIDVESEPSKGTTFRIILPAAKAQSDCQSDALPHAVSEAH